MNTKASLLILSGALLLTILSGCAVAAGHEFHADPRNYGVPETRETEALSLDSLRQRVRGTQAISLGDKIGLKVEIDTLVGKFRAAHQGGNEVGFLRRPYDSLIARLRSMLVRDPVLASDIAVSREAIWDVLADRTKFAGRG
jgi:hypothetical protein